MLLAAVIAAFLGAQAVGASHDIGHHLGDRPNCVVCTVASQPMASATALPAALPTATKIGCECREDVALLESVRGSGRLARAPPGPRCSAPA